MRALGKWLAALAAAALLGAGCTGPLGPLLRWEPRPALEPREGQVAIGKVSLVRSEERGGYDPGLVGQVRSLTGVPIPIRVDETPGQRSRIEWSPLPLEATVQKLGADALAAAGLFLTDQQDASTAVVDFEVTDLWVEGYLVYKSWVTLTVRVLDPATAKPRVSFTTRQQGTAKDTENLSTFAAMNAYDLSPACRIGEFTVPCLSLQRALTATLAELAASFQKPEVRAALLGQIPAAPPPAPFSAPPTAAPPSTPVCEPECSPGYTCLRGVCVSACNPPCPFGQRCGADRVCH